MAKPRTGTVKEGGTHKRLPLVNRENGSEDFQLQLGLLRVCSNLHLLSLEPSCEEFLHEILVRGKAEVDGDSFSLEFLNIQRG